MIRNLLLVAIAVIAAERPTLAQDIESAGDPAADDKVAVETLALEGLLDLESSLATKTERPIERTPATVSVVTDEQVRDFGWLTINDVLAQLPGYARGQDFERRVMHTRGNLETWNSNRTLILVDGAPFNDIEVDGAYTWEATSLAFFKKVEVLRGPASAVYGTNAMSGAVGLETITVEDVGGAGVRANLRLAPDALVMSVVGGQRTELVDAVVGAARYSRDPAPYDDYDGSLRTDGGGALARFPVHDARDHVHLMAKLDGRRFLSGLGFKIHLQDGSSETGHGWLGHIPDSRDRSYENRIIATLRYQHRAGLVSFDHVAQAQRQAYDIRIRFYEDGAFEGAYPSGVTEEIATDLERLFARSQATLDLGNQASLLAGAEYAATLYDGDDIHQANADLVGDGMPFGEFRRIGPLYQPIIDRPVSRVAGFGQLVTGDWLGRHVEVTAGARYDALLYEYVPMEQPAGPEASAGFHQLTPRLGIVATPADWLAIKALAGRAFRTPAIIELFAANTWTTGSNPSTLDPERDTTYELAVDMKPAEWLRWRSNAYFSRRDNAISYAADDLALSNVYSNELVGGESELVGERELGDSRIEGHVSGSYVALVDEESLNPAVSASDQLTDVPALVGKLGARWIGSKLTVAGQLYAQGRTRRRDSSLLTPEFRQVRPDTVPAFVTADAAASYELTSRLRLGAIVTNLLDQRARVNAPYDAAYDFRVDPRRVFVTLDLVP